MVLYEDCMAHHEIAESCNGHRHQPVPGDEQVEDEGVHQADGGGAKHDPGRLEDAGVQAGDNVDDAVADNQTVDSVSLLPGDADTSPQVDNKGDQCEGNICEKVTRWPCLIHLERGF